VFSSEVSLVLLPVFVVDSAGRAVPGLRPENFELTQDGRKAEIVSFRYVDTSDADEQDELKLTSAARRRFLLLFDKSFTQPAGLNRAQKAALDFVRHQLSSSDLAAVATVDVHQGLRMVANFTDDRGLLAHSIETLGVPSLTKVSDPLGLAADLMATDLALTTREGAGQQTQTVLDNVMAVLVKRLRAAEDQAYRSNVLTLAGSFQDLALALRGVEGRKQVLYFSAGFDSRLLVGERGEDQKQTTQSLVEGRLWEVDGNARFGDSRLRETMVDMTRSLSNADTVVHTIDVAGLAQSAGTSLEAQRAGGSNADEAVGRESLSFIAAETGGRFFNNANDLQPALREMLEMTSRYYVLGFQPEKLKGPGAEHGIRVRVARKGVRVSHRPRYYERIPLTAQAPLQRQFEVAQLVVAGGKENDLKLSTVCLPFPVKGERQGIGLLVQVPAESLNWAQRRPSSLEVYSYAVAEDGTVHDHLAQLARLDAERAADGPGESLGVSIVGTLMVPPGRYTIRTLVVERESGSSGLQLHDVTVPPYDATAGFLLPPMLVDETSRWLTVAAAGVRQGASAEGPLPFEAGGKLYMPRTSFAVKRGVPEKMVLVAFEALRPGDPAADVQMRSSMTAADGRAVAPGALRIEKVYRQEGRRTFVLGYTPDQLAAGDYTLRVALGEAGSHLEAYSLIRVQ
jgi:VWFA-related protein